MKADILKPTGFFEKLQFIKNNPEPKKINFTDLVGQFKSKKEQYWGKIPNEKIRHPTQRKEKH